MLPIPEVGDVDIVFGGKVKQIMPKYDDIPEEFKHFHGNVYVEAISTWFFKGCKQHRDGIIVNGVRFTPKEGVDGIKALRAISAVLKSFEPPHEEKEAACAYMLSEWFSYAPV